MRLKRHAHEGRVTALSALQRSSDDFSLALLASGAEDGSVLVWDLMTHQPLLTLPPTGKRPPTALRVALLPPAAGVDRVVSGEHGQVAVGCGLPGGSIRLHLLREGGQGVRSTARTLASPADLEGSVRVTQLAVSEDGRLCAALYVAEHAADRQSSAQQAEEAGGNAGGEAGALAGFGGFGPARGHAGAAGAAGADLGEQVVRVFAMGEPDVSRMWTVRGVGDAALVSCSWGPAGGEPWQCALLACLTDGRVCEWRVGFNRGLLLVGEMRTLERAHEPDSHPRGSSAHGAMGVAEGGRLSEIPITDDAPVAQDDLADTMPHGAVGRFAAGSLPLSALGSARSSPVRAHARAASPPGYSHGARQRDERVYADAYAGAEAEAGAGAEQGRRSSPPLLRSESMEQSWMERAAAAAAGEETRADSRGCKPTAPAPLSPAARANPLAVPVAHSMAALEEELSHLHTHLAQEMLLPPEMLARAGLASPGRRQQGRALRSSTVRQQPRLRMGDHPGALHPTWPPPRGHHPRASPRSNPSR
jgi:hypothetical protein